MLKGSVLLGSDFWVCSIVSSLSTSLILLCCFVFSAFLWDHIWNTLHRFGIHIWSRCVRACVWVCVCVCVCVYSHAQLRTKQLATSGRDSEVISYVERYLRAVEMFRDDYSDASMDPPAIFPPNKYIHALLTHIRTYNVCMYACTVLATTCIWKLSWHFES